MDRRQLLAGGVSLAASAAALPAQAQTAPVWVKLNTLPYRGKQDDIAFATPDIGWYGNGAGKLYKTVDGGATWREQWAKPGTFVRALGFIDEKVGFLGNIGTDYFPGVTDTQPLYRTDDGGETWTPVTAVEGPTVKGVCAIDVQRTAFINAGKLDYRTVVRAGGRVGGPAFLMTSRDGGASWRSEDLSALTAMILDVKFLDAKTGFIAGATSPDIETSKALILRTTDGGASWAKVYEGGRSFETSWKLAFPTAKVGYATVESYDPSEAVTARFVAKTSDGGATWTELPLVKDHAFRAFGVGFIDADHGFIGGVPGGYATSDGGLTWSPSAMGRAVNKIRIVPGRGKVTLYAIGLEVHRMDWPGTS